MANEYPAMNPLLKWLWDMISFYATDEIRTPADFHTQVGSVKQVLTSDVSGLVNSMLDFSINTANVDYIVETKNKELNDIVAYWLNNINISMLGRVPIGIKALSKEYYRERWKNSSLLVLRSTWEDVEINGTKFYLPTKMWFVDGANVKIENGSKEQRIIGTEKYYLKINEKKFREMPMEEDEKIFIQKPFNSWSDLYPTPFLIQRGLWKNLMVYNLINTKGERVVGKALEYLLMMKKGSEQLAMKGDPDYTYGTDELTAIKNSFKTMIANSQTERGTPTYVSNFDTQLEHLIPEYTKILSASLYENVEKRLLAGLGLVDIVEGTSSSRRESILNPKPFVGEIENGIGDFVNLLSDIIVTIQQENINKHKKYMNEKVTLTYHPIKQFVTDALRDHFRSCYDRGILSKQTYLETVGYGDFNIEVTRREFEKENKLDDKLYPPVINNQEQYPNDLTGKPAPVVKKENTPPDKLGPEAKNYKGFINDFEEADAEFGKIVKMKDGWHVVSEKTGKNLGGPYKTRKEAVRRLRQVEWYKHQGKTEDELANLQEETE